MNINIKGKSNISPKKILVLFNQVMIIILTVIFLFLIDEINGSLFYTYCSLIIVLNAILSMFNLRLVGIYLKDISFIFIICSYLLHFGQILIYGFLPNYDFQRFDFVQLMDKHTLISSVSFALNIINTVILGIILAYKPLRNTKTFESELNFENSKYTNRKIYRLGKYITIMCLPLFLYLSYNSITIASQTAYSGGVNTFYGAGIISTLGYFTFSGLYIMAYGSTDKRKRLTIMVIALLLSLGTMFSGERGHQLTFLLALFALPKPLIGKSRLRKIKLSKKILYLVGGYLGIAFINTIFSIRGLEIKSFSVIFTVWLDGLQQNPLLVLVEELGGTIYTIYLTMQKVPGSIEPGYGITYLTSILTFIPNIGGGFTEINLNSHFVNQLNTASLGGSYIGELYYNFTSFGFFPAFIIGIIISKFSRRISNLTIRNSPIELAVTVQVFAYILWWARDSFMSMVRPVVWCLIIVWIIQVLIKTSKKYTQRRNMGINSDSRD